MSGSTTALRYQAPRASCCMCHWSETLTCTPGAGVSGPLAWSSLGGPPGGRMPAAATCLKDVGRLTAAGLLAATGEAGGGGRPGGGVMVGLAAGLALAGSPAAGKQWQAPFEAGVQLSAFQGHQQIYTSPAANSLPALHRTFALGGSLVALAALQLCSLGRHLCRLALAAVWACTPVANTGAYMDAKKV